jgi:hypothetical protein
MYNKELRKIRLFLDSIPGEDNETDDNQYCFDLVEEQAISILDSRFSEFEDGLLEEFLLNYTLLRRQEYLLIDMECPDPVER